MVLRRGGDRPDGVTKIQLEGQVDVVERVIWLRVFRFNYPQDSSTVSPFRIRLFRAQLHKHVYGVNERGNWSYF